MKRTLSFALVIILILCTFASCGKGVARTKEDGKTVMTVGKYEVPNDLVNYFHNSYYDQYTSGTEVDEADAQALENYISEQVNDSLTKLYAVFALCEENGIDTESEEINSQTETEVALFKAENCDDNDEQFAEMLKEGYLNDELFFFLNKSNVLKDALYLKLADEGKIVTDEAEVKTRALNGEIYCTKHILCDFADSDLNYKVITDKNNMLSTVSYITALEALEKYNNGDDFEELLKEYGSDSTFFGTDSCIYFFDGTKEEEYEASAKSIAVGQVSGVTYTSQGFCIIKRYEPDAEYIEENISDLAVSYSEGQFNLMIEECAAGLTLAVVAE